MAKPTLALIPASQGSKLFSVLPSSGVGDFDFSRGSAATRINSQGLIETVANGQSRLDYPLIDGVVSGCPSVLLEPQRTNLISYSEDFSNAYWSPNSNALISLSSNLSPDGTANAYRVEAVTGTQVGYVGTTTIGTTITHSIWVRRISGSTTFNMTDVNNINTSVNITSDWQRFSITSTATSTNLRSYFKTTALGDVVEIYGAQLEQGSFPTSYIKSNSGSTTTRSAETATGAGDATTFNDSEGVLMAEVSSLETSSNLYRGISLTSGNLSDKLTIFMKGDGTNNSFLIEYRVNGLGIVVSETINVSDITSFNKIAIKYGSSGFRVYINGIKEYTNTISSASVNGTYIDIRLNNGFTADQYFYGKTKQLQYFQTVLTDSELEQLTSWISFTDMANGQQYTIE